MSSKKLDFALVKCALENGEKAGDHFGVVTLDESSSVFMGEVYLIQQNCPHNVDRYCDPSKKIAYGSIYKLENDQLVHNADTLGGSSGSPVFSKNNHHVVALHHVGVGNFGNGKGEYNLAIPISAIIDVINKAKPELLLESRDSGNTPVAVNAEPIVTIDEPVVVSSLIPGNSISSAMTLGRGKVFGPFNIKKSGEKHFFKVIVSSSNSNTIFKVNLKGDKKSGDLDLFLLDSQGNELVKSTFNAGDETVRILNKEGVYFIQVAGKGRDIGLYNLEIN